MTANDRTRILHLYSDWKLTGPADPTILLCASLLEQGWEVLLACRPPLEGYPQSMLSKAAAWGVPTTTRLHLNRYMSPGETVKDLSRVRGFIQSQGIGLIHCHLTHDHALGAWASWLCGRRLPVVRTNHKGEPLKPTLGNRWLIGRWTDGLVEYSRRALEEDQKRFGIPEGRAVHVLPAVDLERFDPKKVRHNIRVELGLNPDQTLVGIVARMQRHRKFQVLLEAMAHLKDEDPPIRLMVLGRGTHQWEVAREPSQRMGLGDRILFPGYRTDDYMDYLNAMDVKVLLVPGSDGTCRAVREAMALGKPVVATRQGMLPEIVEDGVTGFVVGDNPEALAGAILQLARRPELRRRMGEAARLQAIREFSPQRESMEVGAFYKAVLGSIS